MADLFASLPWADGQINPSGIKTTIYFCRKTNIASMPRIAAAPATPSENVNVAGDFEMAGESFFHTMYTTQGKGKLTFEAMGEKDHKMFLNKGSFSFPDISAAAKSLAKQTLNSNVVIIVALPHETEKRFIMLGDDDYDVTVTIKGDTGDKPGSEKGITFEIEVPSTTPLPGYTGSLQLENGVLDCETGVYTPTAS